MPRKPDHLTIQKVHECERQFLDAFKAMVESGYVLSQTDFLELLELLKVKTQIASLHQLEKTTAFFVVAAKLLGFSASDVIAKVADGWITNPREPEWAKVSDVDKSDLDVKQEWSSFMQELAPTQTIDSILK